jgi:hypothetical protein
VSYADGWAALHLDKPPRVPRTEYSAHDHWDLVRAATGVPVRLDSPGELKYRARRAFFEAWDYALNWQILLYTQEFGDFRTRMGRSEYAAGGADRDDVVFCPFEDPEQVLRFDPREQYGRIDTQHWKASFEHSYRAGRDAFPEVVPMTGVYVTLISGLIEILGWEMLLMALGTDARRFGELVNRYAEWVAQYFEALALAEVDVVMVHDDMVWANGPFYRPDWYREYVFPNLRKLVRPLVDSGKRVLFTCDGDFTPFIDDIADTGVHGFFLEPGTDMRRIAEAYGETHVFVGNADTRILLEGSREQIRAEVERCMAIGKDCPGFVMAVGNHIPANTPVESALYYNEVFEELRQR